MAKTARLWDRPEDYEKLNLAPKPEVWEDGLRTGGTRGQYEWWYFDARLNDGSTLVIVFYATPFSNTAGHFTPYASFHLTRPDGSHIKDKCIAAPGAYCFSREACRVEIGDCRMKWADGQYRIRYRTENVQAEIMLTPLAAPWRPGTGHYFFGERDFFAWFPAVPEGYVEASISIGGQTQTHTGTGYHDHNWGSTQMWNLLHHWYWGRCKVGEYQVISSYITAGRAYGHTHFPIFLLAKNGEILSRADGRVSYSQADPVLDRLTGKHYFQTLCFEYRDECHHFRVTYRTGNIIERKRFLKKPMARFLFRLRGLAPSYNRFTGTATLERLENGEIVETASAPALWELMHFGTDEDV